MTGEHCVGTAHERLRVTDLFTNADRFADLTSWHSAGERAPRARPAPRGDRHPAGATRPSAQRRRRDVPLDLARAPLHAPRPRTCRHRRHAIQPSDWIYLSHVAANRDPATFNHWTSTARRSTAISPSARTSASGRSLLETSCGPSSAAWPMPRRDRADRPGNDHTHRVGRRPEGATDPLRTALTSITKHL